jgi:uncharacterized protein DUF4375
MTSSPRVRSVSIDDGWAGFTLDAAVVVRVPLRRYGLDKCPTELLATWTLSDDGSCVEWKFPDGRLITIASADAVWQAICDRSLGRLADAGWNVSDLDPRDQRIVALWRLEADGYNGGFLQFYCNWGEEIYLLAVDGLREVGAEATLEVVQRRRAGLDRVLALPDIEEYWRIPALLTDEEAQYVAGDLDELFWSAAEELTPRGGSHYLPGFAAENAAAAQ